MRLMMAPLLVLLSGCWTGDRFYRASDARAAIPAGVYRSLTEENPGTGRVSILASGLTRLAGDDGSPPRLFGFAPLDSQGRRFVVWAARETDGRIVDDAGLYGLLEHRGGGEYLFFLPMCERTATIAAAFGARITPDENPFVCRFPNRESLEAALRRFAPGPEEAIGRLVRVDER